MVEKKKYFVIESIDSYEAKVRTKEFFVGREGLAFETKKKMHFTDLTNLIRDSIAFDTHVIIEGVDETKAKELIALLIEAKEIRKEIEDLSIELFTNEKGEN